MERAHFIDIINRELNKQLSVTDIVEVIQDFCKTNAKYTQYQDIVEFCIADIIKRDIWQQYYVHAKHHFMSKFNVMSCYDVEKEINTPLGPQRRRELLKYM